MIEKKAKLHGPFTTMLHQGVWLWGPLGGSSSFSSVPPFIYHERCSNWATAFLRSAFPNVVQSPMLWGLAHRGGCRGPFIFTFQLPVANPRFLWSDGKHSWVSQRLTSLRLPSVYESEWKCDILLWLLSWFMKLEPFLALYIREQWGLGYQKEGRDRMCPVEWIVSWKLTPYFAFFKFAPQGKFKFLHDFQSSLYALIFPPRQCRSSPCDTIYIIYLHLTKSSPKTRLLLFAGPSCLPSLMAAPMPGAMHRSFEPPVRTVGNPKWNAICQGKAFARGVCDMVYSVNMALRIAPGSQRGVKIEPHCASWVSCKMKNHLFEDFVEIVLCLQWQIGNPESLLATKGIWQIH